MLVETKEELANKERELETKAREESQRNEELIEEGTKKESLGEKSVPEGEKSVDSEKTMVVGEERTEVLRSGMEKEVEEQPSLGEEVDQEAHEKEPEVLEQLVGRGQYSEAEDEEEEETPLVRKLRSTRIAVIEKDPIQPAGEATSTTTDEIHEEEESADDKRYEKEMKRKGKQLEHSRKKKAKQVERKVVIQEPIQVPYG